VLLFAALTIYTLLAILYIVKKRVVGPIIELTNVIQKGGKLPIEKFN